MAELPDAVRTHLADRINPPYTVELLGGGCIAHASRVTSPDGVFFLKWADGEAAGSFPAEAAGLDALRIPAPDGLVIPAVLGQSAAEAVPGFLLLDWIEPGRPDRTGWLRFGESLAALHRAPVRGQRAGRYGFPSDNWIGATPQRNDAHDDWPTFFAECRLGPQFDRARTAHRWHPSWDDPADQLLARLPDLLPHRPRASFLHGDLWSGNQFQTQDGRTALVDPAVYIGDREADLAMTELFGGFDAAFYEAYRAAWPVEPGYPDRRAVYNLYHLVNHLNLFGAGYAAGVERTLMRFA